MDAMMYPFTPYIGMDVPHQYLPDSKVHALISNLQDAIGLMNNGQEEAAKDLYTKHLNKAVEYIKSAEIESARKTYQLFLKIALDFDEDGKTQNAQEIYRLLFEQANKLQQDQDPINAGGVRRLVLDMALECWLDKKNERALTIYDITPQCTLTNEATSCAAYLRDPGSQNLVDAIGHLEIAAKNSSAARYFLGKMYFEGTYGTKVDLLQAAGYIKSAATQGYDKAKHLQSQIAKANFELGEQLEKSEKPDPELALMHYNAAAQAKNPDALLLLGRLHLHLADEKSQIKLEKNEERAIRYLKEVVKKQPVPAALWLAKIYAEKFSTSHLPDLFQSVSNQDEAFKYYGIAANAKNPEAQFAYLVLQADVKKLPTAMLELGKLYLSGKKVPHPARDYVKAEHYLKQAAKNDLDEANYILGSQYKSLTFKSANPAKEALENYQIAVNKGYQPTQAILEILADNGDPDVAWERYLLLANNNSSVSDRVNAETFLLLAAVSRHLDAVKEVITLLTRQTSKSENIRNQGFQQVPLKRSRGPALRDLITFYGEVLEEAKMTPEDPEKIARKIALDAQDKQTIKNLANDPESESESEDNL